MVNKIQNVATKIVMRVKVSPAREPNGLEPPTLFNLHNQGSGGGGFTSLLYNPHPNDQLRFNAGVRLDYYEVPNDPDMQATGIDDHEKEQDAFATFTWVHTFSPGLMLSMSPFYHYNKAVYEGGLADVPITADRRLRMSISRTRRGVK